jgi:acyl-CoA synthetase (NDP forming)
VLPPDRSEHRLRAVGIRLPASAEADDPAAAAAAAAEMAAQRFVLKAGGLLHKSDDGGVVLDLSSPAEIRAAADALVDRLGDRAAPLVIQEQLDGVEVLVGLRRVPGLGTALVVGAGGIYTEILRDVSRSLVPVDGHEARQMIDRLQIRPLLAGARGAEPCDVDALVDLIVAVSALADQHDDIVELDCNPVLVGPTGAGAVAVDVRILVDPDMPAPVGPRAPRDLDALLHPGHVAVVGVSDDPEKVGARLFRHLITHGYEGRLDPIHPAGGEVHGHTRATSLRALDAVPDLVCVAVPARLVAEVAREAIEVGAGAVLVHSSDFAEIGDDGRVLQDELVDLTTAAGVALAGPNDMGVVVPERRLAASISAALGTTELKTGSTALVSSSGALGSCLATRLLDGGLGLSAWIHAGNEADLTIADYLRWLADDPTTSSVGLLLEDIKDGPTFVAAARALVAAGKPVFAYHMVRSEKGQAAAMSHTGSLVGSFELREAVLRAAGVVSVPSLQTLEDALRLTAASGLPAGPRVAALTFSGGACTIIADAAEALGVELPDLDERTGAAVRELLPSFAAVRNPLDVSFQLIADPDAFHATLTALASAGAFDAILVQFTTNADPGAARTAQAVLRVRDDVDIPLYVARYGGAQLAPQAYAIYADAGLPILDAPDRSMQAIAALIAAGRNVTSSH